jgi:hypothetical protein
MTLELDAGTRTSPHGDALLRPGPFVTFSPRLLEDHVPLELAVRTVPLMPDLADACERAAAAWAQTLEEIGDDHVRLALEVRMELDIGEYLGLDAPSRIRANLDAAKDVARLWGIPIVLDPTLEPGQWRLEVEPRTR